jgi:ribosomal protein S18 acetylase RimI-like enzyme
MYADSPDAFSESLATAQAMTAEQWDARARQLAEPGEAVAFVAMAGPEPIGFIAGFLGRWRDRAMHWDGRDTATLARAWVDPRHRGKGVGRALAEAVKAWAVEQGAATLEAQVTEGNEPAIRFYIALGFADTARREPLLSNPTLHIQFLSHPL